MGEPMDENGRPVADARVRLEHYIQGRGDGPTLDIDITTEYRCPQNLPAEAFWKACLTIGTGADGRRGYSGGTGSLAPTRFTYDGTSYTVDGLYIHGANWHISFDREVPNITDWDFIDVITEESAGGEPRITTRSGFNAQYDAETHTYSQPKSRPKWVDGAKVSVALARNPNADDPPIDDPPIDEQQVPPGPPSAFDATPGDGQVTLTWTAPDEDDDITSWQLRYGEADNNGEVDWGAWTRIAGSGRTTSSHTVTGLDNGTGYGFQIRAMAGEVEGTESVSFIVTLMEQPADDPEAPPVIGNTAFTVTEGETAVGTLTATDEDTAAEDLAWSLAGGVDRDHFAITAAGVLTFRSAKDYENPDDSGGNGTYNVTVQVSDGGRNTTAGAIVTLENRNEAPTADAGADQEDIAGGATVTLQGSGSDPDDGDSLSYAWSQTAGTTVTLSSASSASATFTAPADLDADETLTFRLRVTDDGGLTADDTTSVEVLAAPSDPDATREGANTLQARARHTDHSIVRDSLDTAAGDSVDYYVFELDETQELGLGVRDQSIDLDATLEDSSGGTVKKSWPPPVDGSVEWLVATLQPGTYYIRVEAAESGSTNYRIRFGLDDPISISAADASAQEGSDASLEFEVSLSRGPGRRVPVSVGYATVDGTATAGSDYTATSGTLTFEYGETSKTVSVPVTDDDHDEEAETLTLRLSSASEATISDGEATGTITNSDPLPKALLARFGRAAAVHVVEHVEERLAAPREPGFRGQLAGRELRRGMEREMALSFLNRLGGTAGMQHSTAGMHAPLSGAPGVSAGPPGMPGPGGGGPAMGAAAGPRAGIGGPGAAAGARTGPHDRPLGGGLLSMSLGHDPLTGSSFALNRETRHGGVLSFWSRGARSHFAGQEGALSLGGEVRTTMFGADYAKGPLVAGLSLGHSRGLGEYAGMTGGRVASAVTGLYPWLGYKATDRITVWGVAGYGAGGMRLAPEGAPALDAGLSMAMAAAGTRGELVEGAGGFALAFKTDALWVGTSTDGVDGPAGRLAATTAAVNRLRTGLEGRRSYTLGGRLSLRPMIEVGFRQDGGDAETGAGIDVGGGGAVADTASGLAVDVRVRTLVVHQAEGYRERGVALSFSYNPTPSTPLGLTARVAPSWGGQATSGAEALWGRETMAGMGYGGIAQGSRLDGEVGYGLPVGSRFVGTPRVGFSASEHGRDYRIGYALGVLEQERVSFQLGVDAQRRESPLPGGTDNAVRGTATVGW